MPPDMAAMTMKTAPRTPPQSEATVLLPLVPDTIWHAQQPLHFGPLRIGSRMTVVRLDDGALWVHSPIEPTPALIESLDGLGPVRHVVAPNRSHHLFFDAFLHAFPDAQGVVSAGLAKKRPELARFPVIGATPASDWKPQLVDVAIGGLPVLDETVWLHAPSATLIVTDLLCCFDSRHTGLTALITKLLGVRGRLGMSRSIKFMVKDKADFAHSIRRLLAYDIERIVLAHDQVIEGDAKKRLEDAFTWLGDKIGA